MAGNDDFKIPDEYHDELTDVELTAREQDGKLPPLARTSSGAPLINLVNVVSAIEFSPEYRGRIWHDTFLNRMLTGEPITGHYREWTDADDLHLTLWLQGKCGMLKCSSTQASEAARTVAARNPKNCVTDWLKTLEWDGVPRVECFLEDHYGADGTLYSKAASKNFWVSMMARAFRPGCKVDNMLVLEGVQGTKKSSSLGIIAGKWFAEQTADVNQSKSFADNLQGKLLIEIPELDSFSRAEVTRIKAAISNPNDRYRESYGRHATDHPRQCIFVGTTNKDDWSRDETGARRFWPIRCSVIDLDGICANREQLFAEAVALFKAGEPWWLMPAKETMDEQESRYDHDPWFSFIQEFVVIRSEVRVEEILTECLKIETGKISRSDQMRVGSCLRMMKWKKGQLRQGIKNVKIWRPVE